VVAELAGERLQQGGVLDAQPAAGQLGEGRGSRCPAIIASSMARPETPKLSVATVASLLRASTRQLLQPLLVAGPVGGQVRPQPGQVPQPADLGRWDEPGSQPARSFRLASQTASSLSVLGRPGRCVTSRALTSHTVNPHPSSRSTNGRQ
jgi:hypothetical protein